MFNIKEELWDSINRGLVISDEVIEDSTNNLGHLLRLMNHITARVYDGSFTEVMRVPPTILNSVLDILR